jgi:hypothetical protein
MTGWERRLAVKLSVIAISVESHVMNILIAKTMAVICFLFNVRIAQKNMMVVAVKNVNPFTTCRKESKKNYAKER